MAKTKRTTIVEVTAEDIDLGIRRNSSNCMVARALKRARPTAAKVMVDIQTIRFTDTERDERIIWLTPASVQDLIVAFDGGERSRLVPVTFALRRGQAFRLQRVKPATPEDREKRRKARRDGTSQAGTRVKTDTPTNGEAGVVRRVPRSQTTRSYGRRSLAVNQARVRDGDLPAEPEPVS